MSVAKIVAKQMVPRMCRVRQQFDNFKIYDIEADGIIVVGRVKPHIALRGKYESGLLKMIIIGLGKAVRSGDLPRR